MARVLLLGAGFSKNWGGLLASEAFNFLMSSDHADADLRTLLLKHKDSGFEAALDELQSALGRGEAGAAASLEKLQLAVLQMFDAMDAAFIRRGFEFSSDVADSVASFLAKFDAIFTLNQDVLLERYYMPQAQQTLGAHHRSAAFFPGMRGCRPADYQLGDVGEWVPTHPLDMAVPGNLQPIYKLHGSAKWRAADGSRMLIVGGGKTSAINRFPVLKASFEAFDRYLAMPGLRLMIIGYGFGDGHVTKPMDDAAAHADCKTFFVDPWGIDACDPLAKRPYPTGRMPRPINNLQARFAGAVTDPMSKVFSQGGVEFDQLMDFLA